VSSVFLERNHLFLRDERGGVEDVASMRAAGFGAIFCNVLDHHPSDWATIRARAGAAGVVCGPWLRCATADNKFDPDRFRGLLEIADSWESPLIVNAESELKGSGAELTTYIDAQLGERDAALSMETWPFDDVEWWPLAERPVLPQLFKAIVGYEEQATREIWHAYGIKCLVLTFGAYGGSTPSDYDRAAPFGVYSADDCHGDYGAWSALGTIDPCSPKEDEEMEMIGPDHGITATFNRLRELDPVGTLLTKDAKGKWLPLSTLSEPEREGGPVPVKDWKAYDKGERALTILVEDHDQELAT
jgi:hypothetical protein